jgi:hypothetical protein
MVSTPRLDVLAIAALSHQISEKYHQIQLILSTPNEQAENFNKILIVTFNLLLIKGCFTQKSNFILHFVKLLETKISNKTESILTNEVSSTVPYPRWMR